MLKNILCMTSVAMFFSSCATVANLATVSVKDTRLQHSFTIDAAASPKNKFALIVLLHGCDQRAQEFLEMTGFRKLGGKRKFATLTIAQGKDNNRANCFNWFKPENQELKPYSEADQIHRLVEQIGADPRIDKQRIYIVGLSAGGAMAGLVATCYPGVFQAAGIHSSPSFLRASSELGAVKLMLQGPDGIQPQQPPPCARFTKAKMIVLHGDKDRVVHPKNAQALLDDLAEPSQSQLVMIPGLEHAWAGGAENYKYSAPGNGKSTERILEFFGLR